MVCQLGFDYMLKFYYLILNYEHELIGIVGDIIMLVPDVETQFEFQTKSGIEIKGTIKKEKKENPYNSNTDEDSDGKKRKRDDTSDSDAATAAKRILLNLFIISFFILMQFFLTNKRKQEETPM